MNIVHQSRIWLIRFAKVFPFFLCAIVMLSYIEDLFALYAESYYSVDDYTILYKPISWFIGEYFVYNWYTIITATIFSFAFETCWYNKASIVYLCFNAWEREYFFTIELYPECIYAICIANILICGFFCYKGVKIVLKSK